MYLYDAPGYCKLYRLSKKPHLKIFLCLKTVELQPFTSKSLSKDMEVDTFEVELWVTIDKLSPVYSCWLHSPPAI
jgi:hypothetical protein